MRTALVVLALASVGCDAGKPAASPNADPCNPSPPTRCESDDACTPFLCKTSFCDRACTSSATCAKGFVCAANGKCVKGGTCGTCAGDYDCEPGHVCDLTRAQCS